MSKRVRARFSPTKILNLHDREQAKVNGAFPIIKSVLCLDAEDADRLKRIFFRILNQTLKLTHIGYSIEDYPKVILPRNKAPKKDNAFGDIMESLAKQNLEILKVLQKMRDE